MEIHHAKTNLFHDWPPYNYKSQIAVWICITYYTLSLQSLACTSRLTLAWLLHNSRIFNAKPAQNRFHCLSLTANVSSGNDICVFQGHRVVWVTLSANKRKRPALCPFTPLWPLINANGRVKFLGWNVTFVLCIIGIGSAGVYICGDL